MDILKVFICDDHQLYREGLKLLLRNLAHVKLIGEAAAGDEALEQIKKLAPDVAIVDLSMPGLDGVEVVSELKRHKLNTRILILSQNVDSSWLKRLGPYEIDSLVLKSDEPRSVLEALEALGRGEKYFTSKAAQYLYELVGEFSLGNGLAIEKPTAPVNLSAREKEVAHYTSQGKSVKQIAQILGCSENTVKTHKANLMKKIQVSNSVEVATWMNRYRWD